MLVAPYPQIVALGWAVRVIADGKSPSPFALEGIGVINVPIEEECGLVAMAGNHFSDILLGSDVRHKIDALEGAIKLAGDYSTVFDTHEHFHIFGRILPKFFS